MRDCQSKLRLAEHDRDDQRNFAEEFATKEIRWINEKHQLICKTRVQEATIVDNNRKINILEDKLS